MKFGEGERVLCYEPDPNKVKLIHDAKVLEVDNEGLDTRGRRVDQYLVHFQGWNSTWDRWVQEDLLLKESAANRHLQKELYEQMDLNFSSGKNKKKKRRLSEIEKKSSLESKNKMRVSVDSMDRVRDSMDSEESHTNPLDPDDQEIQFSRWGKNDDDDTMDTDTETEPATSPKTVPGEEGFMDEGKDGLNRDTPVLVPLNLTMNSVLKKRLTEDWKRVTVDNKLVKLPAQPNAVSVLEGFVRNYAIQRLSTHEKKSGRSKYAQQATQDKENLEHALQNINVCKEVAEGLRILLDFQLGNLLLYPNEAEQYTNSQALHPHMENIERLVGGMPDIPVQAIHKMRALSSPATGSKGKGGNGKNVPADKVKIEIHAEEASNTQKKRTSLRNSLGAIPKNGDSQDTGSICLSSQGATPGMAMSSVGSTSSGTATPTSLSLSSPGHYPQSAKALDILRQLQQWKMVPEKLYFEEPSPSSLIYGGIHLTRLIVKLPEILIKMKLSGSMSKNIVKYIECLMDYLAAQQDLFTDNSYEYGIETFIRNNSESETQF